MSSVKPVKPSLRQKRMTVAGLVPEASASEFAVAPARHPGSLSIYSAMLWSDLEKAFDWYMAFIFCMRSSASSMVFSPRKVILHMKELYYPLPPMSNFLAPSQSRTQKEKARTERCALLEGVDTLDAPPTREPDLGHKKKSRLARLLRPLSKLFPYQFRML